MTVPDAQLGGRTTPGSNTVESLTLEGWSPSATDCSGAGGDFCVRRGFARMTVLPAGPKGSSFELIADRPCRRGTRDWARQAQDGFWSGKGKATPAGRGSVRRRIG